MTFNYFQFWISAYNEHGIHSPFVFNLLMKGIYLRDKRWRGLSSRDQFIDRVLAYFALQQLATLSGELPVQILTTPVTVVVYQSDRNALYDGILFQGNETKTWPTVQQVAQNMHNDSFFIVDRRNKEEAVEKYWQEVVASSEMIVTLDFYYFGVAFKRKEQLKQHFKLRLHPDRVFRLLRV